MTGDPKRNGAFDGLKQASRRRGPLSFADLSATIVDAQKATGFVDTLSVETQTISDNGAGAALFADANAQVTCDQDTRLDDQDTSRHADTTHVPADSFVSPKDVVGTDNGTADLVSRRGRVRAAVVQCNLKITEELRDALHLQALRERRTIAALVTEVMAAYLTERGTFERLRR